MFPPTKNRDTIKMPLLLACWQVYEFIKCKAELLYLNLYHPLKIFHKGFSKKCGFGTLYLENKTTIITAAATTITRNTSVLLSGFFSLKSTIKNVQTIARAKYKTSTNALSLTNTWSINTSGSTIAIDVIGSP